MAIKRYGLDEAEIDYLKAANLTDEEINALNKKRVQEQMDEEKQDGGDDQKAEFARIRNLMPDVHPLVIRYVMTAPEWEGRDSDEEIKKAYKILCGVPGFPQTVRKDELNRSIEIAVSQSLPNGLDEDTVMDMDFSIPADEFMEERNKEEAALRESLAKEGKSRDEIEKIVAKEMSLLDASHFIGGFIRTDLGN